MDAKIEKSFVSYISQDYTIWWILLVLWLVVTHWGIRVQTHGWRHSKSVLFVLFNMTHGFENVCEHYFGLSKRRPRKMSAHGSCATSLFFHILTSSAGDLLLNRPTTTWNLFVKSVAGKGNACLIVWPMGGRYHEQLKNPPVQVPMNSQDLSSYFCSSGIWGQLPPYFGGGLVQVRERISKVCPRAQRALWYKVPSYSIQTNLPVLKNDK